AATRSDGARADCDGHPLARMKSRRVGARTRMGNRQRKATDYRTDDKVDIILVIRPKLQGSCVALECLTGSDAPELSRCNHLGCDGPAGRGSARAGGVGQPIRSLARLQPRACAVAFDGLLALFCSI